ncbi:relaxase domain-containing protein [Nitriliruptoraceae bacterium ZYF776]|nr:relaxase domain-containing protein [Profundirhabdus halotolerans]
MRVMSAGDGYRYLLASVAAGDGGRDPSTPLTRYYAEAGCPPGFWLGSGIRGLGDGQLRAGDTVSEEQLQLLLGRGCDPITGDPLGHAYPVYRSREDRIDERIAALDPELSVDDRAAAVTDIEAEEAARPVRRAVAGYDYTFSVPKSVSALWAVADAVTKARIVAAHHAAVADVVGLMEREVAATRSGANGPNGAVAQVEVEGLIATAYDHYDSRAGDPQLHTHVVISNKVRTVYDGRWRSLDGRPMHVATVALSEHYNGLLADHLTRTLGVGWEARDRGRNRSRAWEIVGVPERLVEAFSSRSHAIEQETEELIARYRDEHGRRPSATTILKLRAQATLATRPAKTLTSLAELTGQWRARASGVLETDATGWAADLLTAEDAAPLLVAEDLPLETLAEVGQAVVVVMGEKRSTWRRWNLHAEASRQVMDLRFASTVDREAVVGLIVDAAERASLRLTPPELATSPAAFQRLDGSSVFRPKHAVVFSSTALLEAEDRLLDLADTTTGPTASIMDVERGVGRTARKGRRLGADQHGALRAVAGSGRMVDVLVGPAGAGKTTTMHALRHVWETAHGAGSVVGLAPSAAAAQVLGDDLDMTTENTAKWLHDLTTTGAHFRAEQLVIIDEASMVGTLTLDRITRHAAEAGAKVLLVGDPAQLAAVDAGGAFGMLARARDDAPSLSEVRRFHHDWEAAASLRLRAGDLSVIDTYQTHGRIREGETADMLDAAYQAWTADLTAGRSSLMIAETVDTVTLLNTRARLDRIVAGHVAPTGQVTLHDGTEASTGDLVVTRRNHRRLTVGRGWVTNGDRWTVVATGRDGSLTVRRPGRRHGPKVTLPADYVAAHVELAYATTAYRAQGATVDTAHAVVQPGMTRETCYVALTRGRDANIAYVATDQPDTEHHQHPADTDVTARSVLTGVLRHVGAEPSALETITAEQHTWASIAQLAAEYGTIAAAAQHHRWATLIRRSGLDAGQVAAMLASEALGPLAAELRRAEADGHDLDEMLPRLVAARGFDDADDIAAVLHHRVANATTGAPSEAGRRPSRLIAGLIPPADGPMTDDLRQALTERAELIEQRAAALAETAVADGAAWTRGLGDPPVDPRRRHAWRRQVSIVAAYRDRYEIDTDSPLGLAPETGTAQHADATRTHLALRRARHLAHPTLSPPGTAARTGSRRSAGPTL